MCCHFALKLRLTIVRCVHHLPFWRSKWVEKQRRKKRISSKWECAHSVDSSFLAQDDCQLADMSNHTRSQRCKNIAITAICFDTIDKRFVDSKRFLCHRRILLLQGEKNRSQLHKRTPAERRLTMSVQYVQVLLLVHVFLLALFLSLLLVFSFNGFLHSIGCVYLVAFQLRKIAYIDVDTNT